MERYINYYLHNYVVGGGLVVHNSNLPVLYSGYDQIYLSNLDDVSVAHIKTVKEGCNLIGQRRFQAGKMSAKQLDYLRSGIYRHDVSKSTPLDLLLGMGNLVMSNN